MCQQLLYYSPLILPREEVFCLTAKYSTLICYNMAERGLTDIYARSRGRTAPEEECGYISKTLSTSVLQHLCNTFNVCVQLCAYLLKHNSIASNVLHSKMPPYWSHISEAEEKTQWLKML